MMPPLDSILSSPTLVASPPADAPLRITTAETGQRRKHDRFHRFRLISWWDQTKLAKAKVLVVGAGALGNEIVKNLALLGVGNIFIADLDKIENSNLSRSILYRESDNGSYKAGSRRSPGARDVYPQIKGPIFRR